MTERSDLKSFVDISRYKSILCLDGRIPTSRFFKEIGLPLIAADGAANRLHEIGIKPDLVIGDCDSVMSEILDQTPHKKIQSQDDSDFEKALKYLEENGLMPAIICGISGGYLDHIMNNVGIFMQHDGNIFVDDEIVGYSLNGIQTFKIPLNAKLSIIGMPSCTISTNGLKWELNNAELNYPGMGSFFNRCVSKTLKITIHKGKALMIVYTNEIIDAGLNY